MCPGCSLVLAEAGRVSLSWSPAGLLERLSAGKGWLSTSLSSPGTQVFPGNLPPEQTLPATHCSVDGAVTCRLCK